MASNELQKLNESFRGISHQLGEVLQRWDLEAAAEGMKRFEAGFGDQLYVLAQHGWFISWSRTPLAWIYPLAALFRDGHLDEGHRHMSEHFVEWLPSIEKHLVDVFPSRAGILQKAFRAHETADYELSVPVFLSQADGIAKEVIGTSIYSRRETNINTIRDFIDAVTQQSIDRDMLELALLPIPLNVSERNPLLLEGALNRHEVLHGVDTSYATVRNSLRAVSWLQYVALFRERDEVATARKSRDGAGES